MKEPISKRPIPPKTIKLTDEDRKCYIISLFACVQAGLDYQIVSLVVLEISVVADTYGKAQASLLGDGLRLPPRRSFLQKFRQEQYFKKCYH